MTVKFTSLALAVLLVLPVMCATSYVHEILVVDTALDGGAAYDYIDGKPDYSAGHPFIPLFTSASDALARFRYFTDTRSWCWRERSVPEQARSSG